MARSTRWRTIRRFFLGLFVLFLLGAGVLIAMGWTAFGTAPEGPRLARMESSAQWSDGVFENPQPLWNDPAGMFGAMFSPSPVSTPSAPLPIMKRTKADFATPPKSGLRVTWLGHSTLLFEIDGTTILTDPIFGGRAAPFNWAGPATWYGPPLPLSELPEIDVVIISHDHYDHLQMETIQTLATRVKRFITPLGVGAHLEYWGVPAENITEMDWWEGLKVGEVQINATPARHASGRQILDQNRTLWAGYALMSAKHRVFFSGDTGLFPAMAEIGERFGPFDIAFVESGAYNQAWPDWHLGPEQAVFASELVGAKLMVPIHWGMIDLAAHGWTEPAERVLAEAALRNQPVFIPRPGEQWEGKTAPKQEQWWPDVAWTRAADDPICARGVEELQKQREAK